MADVAVKAPNQSVNQTEDQGPDPSKMFNKKPSGMATARASLQSELNPPAAIPLNYNLDQFGRGLVQVAAGSPRLNKTVLQKVNLAQNPEEAAKQDAAANPEAKPAADSKAAPALVSSPEAKQAAVNFKFNIVSFLSDPASTGKIGHESGNPEVNAKAAAATTAAEAIRKDLAALEAANLQASVKHPAIAKMVQEGQLAEIQSALGGVKDAHGAYQRVLAGQEAAYNGVLQEFTGGVSLSFIKGLQAKAVIAEQKKLGRELTAEEKVQVEGAAKFDTFRIKIDKGTKLEVDDSTISVAEAKARIEHAGLLNQQAAQPGANAELRRQAVYEGKAAKALSKRLDEAQAAHAAALEKFQGEQSTQIDAAATSYLDSVIALQGKVQGAPKAVADATPAEVAPAPVVTRIVERIVERSADSAKDPNGFYDKNGVKITKEEDAFLKLASTAKYQDFQGRLEAQIEKFSPLFGKNCDPEVAEEMNNAVAEKRGVNLTKEQLKDVPETQVGYIFLINEAYAPVKRDFKLGFKNRNSAFVQTTTYPNAMTARAHMYAVAAELDTKKGEETNYDDPVIRGMKYRHDTKSKLGQTPYSRDFGPQEVDGILTRLEGLSVEDADTAKGMKAIRDSAREIVNERELTTGGELNRGLGGRFKYKYLTSKFLIEDVILPAGINLLTASLGGKIIDIMRGGSDGKSRNGNMPGNGGNGGGNTD